MAAAAPPKTLLPCPLPRRPVAFQAQSAGRRQRTGGLRCSCQWPQEGGAPDWRQRAAATAAAALVAAQALLAPLEAVAASSSSSMPAAAPIEQQQTQQRPASPAADDDERLESGLGENFSTTGTGAAHWFGGGDGCGRAGSSSPSAHR